MVVTVATPTIVLSHFPFHTGELSSITRSAHGRATSNESSHSVEEQSTPPVKRKCTRDEDIMAAIPGIEQESVQPHLILTFLSLGAAQASCSAIHVSFILGIYTCTTEAFPKKSTASVTNLPITYTLLSQDWKLLLNIPHM